MGVFGGCQVTLELTGVTLPYKEKKRLRELITQNDGIISYIINKKTSILVLGSADRTDCYKCRTAVKLGIPVVSLDYVEACVRAETLLHTDNFLLVGKSVADEFSTGKIAAPRSLKPVEIKKTTIDINKIKVWKTDEKGPDGAFKCFQPGSASLLVNLLEGSCEVAKYVFLHKLQKEKGKKDSAAPVMRVLELQVAAAEPDDSKGEFKYRVMTQETGGSKEYRYIQTAGEALQVYSQLYDRYTKHPHNFSRVEPGGTAPWTVGSPQLLQMLHEVQTHTPDVSPRVLALVDSLWEEALGNLAQVLIGDVLSIKVDQIDKAEALLLQLKQAVDRKAPNDELQKLSTEFYSTIPHRPGHKDGIKNKKEIARKQDMCQLIRDMVSVSEATSWKSRPTAISRYHALRCNIQPLDTDSKEYRNLEFMTCWGQENSGPPIKIENIFRVWRSVEETGFNSVVGNVNVKFHSSQAQNFVGILSRGLLLPKVVVDDYGGTRTDAGMLGHGIYFSDAGTSAKYSSPSKTRGTRYMMVNEVALGKCKDVYQQDTTLTQPPEGYDSMHGVKGSEELPSEFKDDEYVIYNVQQQKMKYLVEFSLPGDQVTPVDETAYLSQLTPEDMGEVEGDLSKISLEDVQNIADPLDKVKGGLISKSGEESPIPLQSVHVRAKLMDLAAQVVVLQSYKNENNVAIEAKYVFPLDDMAAVCGFEAFINGKHVVGEVKEKEEAHREYRQAISEGHGAYLMDEETPDVFTVSVGNLPPKASVLIKITYVAELAVEGDNICFRLPGSVAPWQKDSALSEKIQEDLETVKVEKDAGKEFSLQVAVEMPFDIRTIQSPSHKIRVKRTAAKAVVELEKNCMLGDGFLLQVGLAEIHVPRMWVERHPDKDSQACMLTFYPEFQAEVMQGHEVILVLDASNSMRGPPLEAAKKVALLCLHHLPKECSFNVVAFGTGYEELFAVSQPKLKSHISMAENFIQNLKASKGNTDAWRPLHSFFLLPPSGKTRNVFLISDGHVNNTDQTLSDIHAHYQETRVFSFGVGSTANKHLLRALARVGGGAFEYFDTKTKSKWESKVKNQLWKAAQPGLTSVSVDWQQWDDDAESPVQAPNQIVSLFNGSRQVVYGYVPHCTQASLKAVINNREISTMVSTSDLSITTGKILHQLTARAVIRDWEDGTLHVDRMHHETKKMGLKPYIIDISKEYSIVTQFTSFVAVEKREKDEDLTTGEGPSIEELVGKESVDILSYMGWETGKEDDWADMEKFQNKELKPPPEDSSLLKAQQEFQSRSELLQVIANNFKSDQPRDQARNASHLLSTCHKLLVKTHQNFLQAAKEVESLPARGQHDSQLKDLCHKMLKKFDDKVTEVDSTEMKIFFHQMKGHFNLLLAECTEGHPRKCAIEDSFSSYTAARDIAKNELLPTHPTVLELQLALSKLCYDELDIPEEACQVAKSAFDDAIAELDTLSEESYKDSTLLMQQLRDNLTVWATEDIGETDETRGKKQVMEFLDLEKKRRKKKVAMVAEYEYDYDEYEPGDEDECSEYEMAEEGGDILEGGLFADSSSTDSSESDMDRSFSEAESDETYGEEEGKKSRPKRAVAVEKGAVEEEESDEEMGFGLFDDDDEYMDMSSAYKPAPPPRSRSRSRSASPPSPAYSPTSPAYSPTSPTKSLNRLESSLSSRSTSLARSKSAIPPSHMYDEEVASNQPADYSIDDIEKAVEAAMMEPEALQTGTLQRDVQYQRKATWGLRGRGRSSGITGGPAKEEEPEMPRRSRLHGAIVRRPRFLAKSVIPEAEMSASLDRAPTLSDEKQAQKDGVDPLAAKADLLQEQAAVFGNRRQAESRGLFASLAKEKEDMPDNVYASMPDQVYACILPETEQFRLSRESQEELEVPGKPRRSHLHGSLLSTPVPEKEKEQDSCQEAVLMDFDFADLLMDFDFADLQPAGFTFGGEPTADASRGLFGSTAEPVESGFDVAKSASGPSQPASGFSFWAPTAGFESAAAPVMDQDAPMMPQAAPMMQQAAPVMPQAAPMKQPTLPMMQKVAPMKQKAARKMAAPFVPQAAPMRQQAATVGQYAMFGSAAPGGGGGFGGVTFGAGTDAPGGLFGSMAKPLGKETPLSGDAPVGGWSGFSFGSPPQMDQDKSLAPSEATEAVTLGAPVSERSVETTGLRFGAASGAKAVPQVQGYVQVAQQQQQQQQQQAQTSAFGAAVKSPQMKMSGEDLPAKIAFGKVRSSVLSTALSKRMGGGKVHGSLTPAADKTSAEEVAADSPTTGDTGGEEQSVRPPAPRPPSVAEEGRRDQKRGVSGFLAAGTYRMANVEQDGAQDFAEELLCMDIPPPPLPPKPQGPPPSQARPQPLPLQNRAMLRNVSSSAPPPPPSRGSPPPPPPGPCPPHAHRLLSHAFAPLPLPPQSSLARAPSPPPPPPSHASAPPPPTSRARAPPPPPLSAMPILSKKKSSASRMRKKESPQAQLKLQRKEEDLGQEDVYDDTQSAESLAVSDEEAEEITQSKKQKTMEKAVETRARLQIRQPDEENARPEAARKHTSALKVKLLSSHLRCLPTAPVSAVSDISGLEAGVVPIVTTRGSSITETTVDRIFALLKHTEEGLSYWEFSDELDQLLNISSGSCVQIFNTAGLKSLGAKVARQLLQLVASLLVLQLLMQHLPQLFPSCRTLLQLDVAQVAAQWRSAVQQVLTWAKGVDSMHPLVYSRLELGRSWDDVTRKLIGVSGA